jgi:hypothetical protein
MDYTICCEDEEEYILSKELHFSFINSPEGLLACDGSHHAIRALDDWVRPFERILQVPFSQKVGNSRDLLKPYLDELFTCLDFLDNVTQIEKFSKLVEVEVGRFRCIIAQSTQKRRQQVENVTSVNVVVEMRSNNPKRIMWTRHIDHY